MSHITLAIAEDMTALYRQNREAVLAEDYQNKEILALNETFPASEVEDVLKQTGCVGLRIYYGMDENQKVHAILVGVNSSDEDILPSSSTEVNSNILEQAIRCPQVCPPPSSLNS